MTSRTGMGRGGRKGDATWEGHMAVSSLAVMFYFLKLDGGYTKGVRDQGWHVFIMIL